MRVLVKEGESVLADLSFEDEQIAIGSHPACNIHLPDYRISERNALITPSENNSRYIQSLDYSHPVMVNDHMLTDRVQIQNNDEINLHGYLLKVYLDADLDRQQVLEDPQLSGDELAKIMQFPLPSGTVVKRNFDPVTLP